MLEVIVMFDVVLMQRLSAVVGTGVEVYMRKYHPSLGWNPWAKL